MSKTKQTLVMVATFLGFLLLSAAPAHADLIFGVSGLTSTLPGDSGAFEVTLTNTGASSAKIDGFLFDLTASSPGVTFSDATTAETLVPYIFTGNSLFGPSLAFATQVVELQGADVAAVPYSYYELAANSMIGLGYVTYSVDPGAPLSFTGVTFQDYGGATSVSTVPELTSFAILLLFGVVLGALALTPLRVRLTR